MHRRDGIIAAGRRTTLAVAVSLIAHAAVLTVLARHAPMLRIPYEEGGPPEPIIPILLMPRTPPPAAGRPAGPSTIRLHRRPQRFAPPPEAPVLVVPPVIRVAPAKPAAPPPPSQIEIQQAKARVVLRRGLLGCANAQAAGLSREERDRCNDALARGVTTAPPLGLGLGAGAGGDFDRAQARDRARAAPPPVGTTTGGPGSSAADLGARR